jgi:PAS domain S-box-containing protein
MSKVLIVDDNKDFQYLLQKIMEIHDHEAIFADNGSDALEKARHNLPDIIVSDILMPGMDGITLCSRWKSDDILKKIPFVIYTGTYTDKNDEEAALKAGADRFLRKTLEPEEFMNDFMKVINNADNIKAIDMSPGLETEEDSYKLYNDRLVRKLEEKTLEREREVARRRQTEEALKLNQIELEIQNEELRNTHKMLEKSRSRYADLYDFAPVGYFSFDKKGVILDLNLTCAEMLGTERSSLIKKPFLSFVVRDDHDILYLHCKEVLKTGTSMCNLRITRNDGSEFLAHLESIGIKESEGNCNHCRTAITDVTWRIKADEALQESEARWRSLAENAPDIILTVDREGKILFINKTDIGIMVEDAIGTNVLDYVTPENHDIVRQSIQKVFETGSNVHYETSVQGQNDRNLWYTTHIGPVKHKDEVVSAVMITRDITDRKQSDDELRDNEDRFRRLSDASFEGIARHCYAKNFL